MKSLTASVAERRLHASGLSRKCHRQPRGRGRWCGEPPRRWGLACRRSPSRTSPVPRRSSRPSPRRRATGGLDTDRDGRRRGPTPHAHPGRPVVHHGEEAGSPAARPRRRRKALPVFFEAPPEPGPAECVPAGRATAGYRYRPGPRAIEQAPLACRLGTLEEDGPAGRGGATERRLRDEIRAERFDRLPPSPAALGRPFVVERAGPRRCARRPFRVVRADEQADALTDCRVWTRTARRGRRHPSGRRQQPSADRA